MLATALTSIAAPLSPLARPPASRPVRLDILAHRLITSVVRSYESKQHVFWEDDPASHVYKIETGHVCVYRMMPDGRRQVIDFAYPGDVIGLGALNEHSENAQATTKTRVRCAPISVLHEGVSRELVSVRELLCTISQRSAGERIAAFLIALSRRNQRCGDNPNAIRLPMTRGDIADFLGLTIETVSRAFTKFRMEGLIDLQQSLLVTVMLTHCLSWWRENIRGMSDAARAMITHSEGADHGNWMRGRKEIGCGMHHAFWKWQGWRGALLGRGSGLGSGGGEFLRRWGIACLTERGVGRVRPKRGS